MLPENPLEIPEFADLWHDAKTDWDLVFRTSMGVGYLIGKGFEGKTLAEREGILKGIQIAFDNIKSQETDETT